MLTRLAQIPMLVILAGLSGLAMLVPAAHAMALDDHAVGRAFLQSGVIVLAGTLLLALATAGRPLRNPARSHLRGLVLAYALLPPLLGLPLLGALPEITPFDAWFEMVSSLTTTGATVLAPAELPPSVHLWRGLVGWAGGLLVLVGAGILADLNLGGFELYAPRALGQQRAMSPQGGPVRDPGLRRLDRMQALLAAYAGVTGLLWIVLLIAGDPGLVALMHAMAVLSTSGITPLSGLGAAPSGLTGEMILFLALGLALSRRFLPAPPGGITATGPIWRDPEIRVGLTILMLVSAAMLLHHWVARLEATGPADPVAGLRALWGALFTLLSFLTTTGFESSAWTSTLTWSGLGAAELILLGLAIIGGGVATTAGGVTLLRVYALFLLARREMERLSEPSSVGGGGPAARQMRGEGAFVAFVFFMLFALTLGVVNLALAALGLEFETALVFSVSAVSTTGPLAEVSRLVPLGWSDLDPAPRAVLALAMVLGRLETLVLVALLLPMGWRR